MNDDSRSGDDGDQPRLSKQRPAAPRSGGRSSSRGADVPPSQQRLTAGDARLATGRQPTTSPRTGAQRSGSERTGNQRAGVAASSTQRSGAQRTGTQRTGSQTARSLRKARRDAQPRWRRILRRIGVWSLVSLLAFTAIFGAGLAIAYARIEIPQADDFALEQQSIVYYNDGENEIGRLGQANRESVAIDSLPEHVPHAIVAAEDRSFYTNPGVDLMATGRAMFRTIFQGKRQGGSTITQQYVERYYVGETTTDIPGKIKEALLALKIDSQESKDDILENYMNTIYFGRGAYGIQAAAREYFGKDAKDLTVSESALLAGIIPAPSVWDPQYDEAKARERWAYVLDGMVEEGWLTPAERFRQEFPETIPQNNSDTYGGPKGYILRAALEEVAEETDLTIEEIETRGYRIVTSIDKKVQSATTTAAKKLPDGHSDNLRMAIVTIDPDTGGILSMYGGEDYVTVPRNAVTQDIAQAGSTFKPFALITALEQGYALESEFNGNSNLKVDGFSKKVRNFGNISYGQINLIKATANSVNTVYAQLGAVVGPENVMETAIDAGLPRDTAGLEPNPANVLGTASPHPLDMASAYATLASGGVATEPFLVSKVLDADGKVVWERSIERNRVFSEDVVAETVYAMQQVVRSGTGSYVSRLGRPVAGKTGTSNDNKSAWFIGFTPQIVGAVALYQVGPDGEVQEIKPFGGFSQITGGSVPARIWYELMKRALKDEPVENFPKRSYIGETIKPETEEPSPEPSPEASPEPEPSASTGDPGLGDVGDILDFD